MQQNPKAATGAAIGAVAGAVIGHQINHGDGKWVGAVLGALAGGAIGHYMDQQQREMEQKLAKERAAGNVEVQRMPDDTLKLTLASKVSFDFDSAKINPGFADALDRMAEVIRKYDKTMVHVIGHTDSVGSEEYNQRLSEDRAEAVADYLVSRGVDRSRIRTEGRGEREPRATNDTEAGRQLNRRVEIYLRPIEKGNEQKAAESPRYY